jgi:hypothetical protein
MFLKIGGATVTPDVGQMFDHRNHDAPLSHDLHGLDLTAEHVEDLSVHAYRLVSLVALA